MTGKITVGTIQDTDGNTVAATYVTNGSAKAWVKYNQSTPGVDNSLNVSSVTDNATAKYTINYTNNWANIIIQIRLVDHLMVQMGRRLADLALDTKHLLPLLKLW